MKRIIILSIMMLATVTLASRKVNRYSGPYISGIQIIVAATNAGSRARNVADYKCSGTASNSEDDALVINRALLEAYNQGGGLHGGGGVVILTPGSYYITTSIVMQPRVSLIGQTNLQSPSIWSRTDMVGPLIYYNSNGSGREGQFEISGLKFAQRKTTGEWAVYFEANKAWTLVSTTSLAGNPPIPGTTVTSDGGGTGMILVYTATSTVEIGPDSGQSFSGAEEITYIGTSGAGTFTIDTANEVANKTPLKDCIFENNYITLSTGDGWYTDYDWAGHYENCTFEYCQGVGFHGRVLSFTEFNGCYFAHNTEEGFLLEGTNASCGGMMLTNCSACDNGDVQLGNNPDPASMSPFAGFRIKANGDMYDPCNFIGCMASMNSGWGFYLEYGWFISLTDCTSLKNNWQEGSITSRRGGYYIEDTAKYARLTSCLAIKNDVFWSGSSWTTGGLDAKGSGFIVLGDKATLSNCFSGKNAYGIWLEADDCVVDCRYGKDTYDNGQNIYVHKSHYGSVTGRIVIDVFDDPGVLDDDGVYTHAFNNHTTTDAFTNPNYARVLTIQGLDGTANGYVTIQGLDSYGNEMGSNAILTNGEDILTTVRAYAIVTYLNFSNDTGGAKIGWKDALGLSKKVEIASDVFKILKNGSILATTAYTVEVDGNDVPYGVITLDDAIQANDVFEVFYRTN